MSIPPVSRVLVLALSLEALGLALALCGFLSTAAFLSSAIPAEAARHSSIKIPAECEAVVLNHGHYLCWYTISNHPFLFCLSVASLVAGPLVFRVGRQWDNGA
jgi:hypothetical protein